MTVLLFKSLYAVTLDIINVRRASTSRATLQRSSILQFQRRFASEEAQTQSEPVADGAQAQHGDNSIAASSKAEAESSTQDSQERSASSQGQEHSTIGELASSAASTFKETASSAYDTIAGGSGSGPQRGHNSGSGARQYDVTPRKSVYVGNLFFDVKEDDLRKKFEQCGTIEGVKLIMDNRGLSKGFGYVNFTSQEAADAAIETFNEQPFEGRRLTVQYAAPRAPLVGRHVRNVSGTMAPTRTLFIGNMSFEMSDRELNDLFREIRNVVDVRVAIDRRTGQPRGFAHADFTDLDSAKEAMLTLSGKEVCGRALRVDYSQSTGRARDVRTPRGGEREAQQGAECSTAGNPLSQFTKHVQDDKSLQRDRLVGSGSAGVQEGFRTQRNGANQEVVSEI
ncbi:MAG: hypothetical protein Q9178_007368 [Gyalolechia marmorata]